MEQFGALGVLDALHASSEMKSYRYRTRFPKPTDCDTAIIDITDLDRLKYCFAANDHTTEDALTYLARISYPPTEKQRLLQCQRVAYALAKFEVIENIRVLPGVCHIHTLTVLFFFLVWNRTQKGLLLFLSIYLFSFFLFHIREES